MYTRGNYDMSAARWLVIATALYISEMLNIFDEEWKVTPMPPVVEVSSEDSNKIMWPFTEWVIWYSFISV